VRLDHDALQSSEFEDCTFVRCSFAESVLRECSFAHCVFRQCDLSLVHLPSTTFSACRIEDSKVLGVNWTQARWPTTRLWEPVAFVSCVISHSVFIGLNLKGIVITNCVAVDVDFRDACLSQADFTGTDLSRSQFSNTDLTEADMSRARNYTIDPRQNSLKGAKFSLPEAVSLLCGLDIVMTDGEP
jgi:uncharacterized protein YjbI with pentapeptide repeats